MTKFVQADPNKVLILDISKWQDDPATAKIVDFVKLKSLGVRGVIIKCGEGNGIDRAFKSYVEAMELAKMPYGVYWYYNNKYDPKKQALLFSSTLDQTKTYPQLGLWLDLEDRNPGTFMGWKQWYNFLSELRRRHPKEIIGIYTGHPYFTEHTIMAGISSESLKWFEQFPLWIASYTFKPKATKPWGENWKIWQFTDILDGEYYGVESKELDGNYFNGTLDEYVSYFGLNRDITVEVKPVLGDLIDVTMRYVGGVNIIVSNDGNKENLSNLISALQRQWRK